MKNIRVSGLAAMVLAVFVSLDAAASTTITDRRILRLAVFEDSAIIEYTPATGQPPEGCPGGTFPDRKVTIEWSTSPDRKVILATAMMAYATNATVNFQVIGCYRNYAKVHRIDLNAQQQ